MTLTGTLDLRDSDAACRRLEQTVRKGEQIVIYQDYDADGCSTAAVMLECLSGLNARVDVYVNDRKDG